MFKDALIRPFSGKRCGCFFGLWQGTLGGYIELILFAAKQAGIKVWWIPKASDYQRYALAEFDNAKPGPSYKQWWVLVKMISN